MKPGSIIYSADGHGFVPGYQRMIVICIFFLCFMLGSSLPSSAQDLSPQSDYSLLNYRLGNQVNTRSVQDDSVRTDSVFPNPKSVLYKSMILPGWGQAINEQWWKVPVIYGLFAGLGYYTHELTIQYHDYRAAYYNLSRGEETDFRFGQTPDYISENVSLEELRNARNTTRNRRDMMFIYMGLAYGLNVLDAYVYAHMKSFDVSDDLSANTRISPGLVGESSPGIRVRIQFQSK